MTCPPPSDRLVAAISALDQMAAFLRHWTREADRRAQCGDHSGAVAALTGMESMLAEMARLYAEACKHD